jgi:diguanylate cyclase (GGDEF)-like protein
MEDGMSDVREQSSYSLENKSPEPPRTPGLTPDDELFKTIMERLVKRLEVYGRTPTRDDLEAALQLGEAELLRRTQQFEPTIPLSEAVKSLYQSDVHSDLKAQADSMLSLIDDAQYAAAELEKKDMDFLTETFNKDKFTEDVGRLLEGRRKNQPDFCLLLIDADGLKNVNDTYGHEAGDALIIGVAEIFKKTAREVDRVYRWGGDEFTIVAQGDVEGARILAQRILEKCKNTHIEVEKGIMVQPSVSIGIASPEHLSADPAHRTVKELVKLADKAMYTVKHSTKNNFAVY